MPKLSLCMIVKNEEANLPQCLTSVQNLVDEMIIMDTGSSDRTVEIAQEFGAIVPTYQWKNHFSEARNEALKYVSGDWILVLDADEKLNPKIIPQIEKVITNEKAIAINLIRQEIGAKQSPYSLITRLFRNHPQVKFTRPYHSIVDDSITELLKQEKHWKIIDLSEIAIFHYGYTQEAIASLDKYNRARKAMESFWRQNPHDAYVCSKLGALYIEIGEEKKGVKLLKQGLKSNPRQPHILYELHYHLGNIYAKQKQLEQAAKHYQKAIEQPILAQLKLGAFNNIGSLFQLIGDFKKAYQAYQNSIKIDPTFAMGYFNLGMTLKAMGKLSEAITAYENAIKYEANYAPAYQNLGVVYWKKGQILESTEAFKKALELHNSQNNLEEARRLQEGLQEIGINLGF